MKSRKRSRGNPCVACAKCVTGCVPSCLQFEYKTE